MRYYYKNKDNTGFLNLKEPLIDDNYIEITEEEFNTLTASKERPVINTNKKQINELKQLLKSTDYQAIKYAEGVISEEEYAPIKAQREEWRRKINELEENK